MVRLFRYWDHPDAEKTTLLNLILGITEADSGKIWFNGEDITNLAMEKKRIQYRVSGLRIISESECI